MFSGWGCVFGRVEFGRFLRVVSRLDVVPVRQMGVVTGLFVVTRFVVLGRGLMVLSRLLVMMCRLGMMISALFRHRNLSRARIGATAPSLAT
jgi:hypothetical protein